MICILVETDGVLYFDDLWFGAYGFNKLKTPDTSIIVITHYERLLDIIKPDFIHILYQGRIVKTGGPLLAKEIEKKGYDWIKAEVNE